MNPVYPINEIVFVPLDVATEPRNGECIVDSWWSHVPGRGLLFYRMGTDLFPQCNGHRDLAERLTAKMYPDAEVLFVPVVFTGPARHRL